MAVEVKIPPMGESITGGLLAAWLVKSGDAVRKGQPLFSYETDKVTSEGTAEVDGQITIVVNAGTDVVVGQVVASIEAGAAGNAPSAAPAPAAKPAAASAPVAAAPAPKAAPVAAKSGAAAEISPAVRRISEETGLDPAGLEGTGKAGRVTKGDMLAALSGQAPSLPLPPPPLLPLRRPPPSSSLHAMAAPRASACRRFVARSRNASCRLSPRPRCSRPSTRSTWRR
jgi:2-oxoglutarate dehydrogenase E2 component (dihydrolipoamide succinyltransferase)